MCLRLQICIFVTVSESSIPGTTVETASLVASMVSIIIGIGAVALSVVFYRMSSDAQRASENANKDIQASVSKLDAMFNSMYSDTFSLVRDSYRAMHQSAWEGAEEPDDAPDGGEPVRESAVSSSTSTQAPQETSESQDSRERSRQVPDDRDEAQERARRTAARRASLESARERRELRASLKTALERAWGDSRYPSAAQLQLIGERLGYDTQKVVKAMFDVYRDGGFHTVGNLQPGTLLYPSQEVLEREQGARIDQVLKDVIDDDVPF